VNAGVLGGNVESPRHRTQLLLKSRELNLAVATSGALPAITHTVIAQVLGEGP
jgi:hypothetical protein